MLGFITLGLTRIINGLMVLLRKDKRAIHDFLSGTFAKNSFDKYFKVSNPHLKWRCHLPYKSIAPAMSKKALVSHTALSITSSIFVSGYLLLFLYTSFDCCFCYISNCCSVILFAQNERFHQLL